MAPVQKKYKKYDLKFKLSVVKYAEENSGEAAARRFSVDPKRVRDWRKSKTELQRLSEEDSNRARLPGGGRKKASEELEKNMRDWVIGKRARQERVSRRMIRTMAKKMYATVSDSRDEEFAASAGWLNRFLPRNNFTGRRHTASAQDDAREFIEKLVKFVTFSSRMIETKKIPDRDIIAMVETAVSLDTVGSTTVETRGARSVPLETIGQEKSHMTVVLAAKADGTKLKPFVVFKGGVKEVKAMQSIGGVVIASSKNGCMNDNLTADWLQKVVGKTTFGPRLLVWDSDRCHIGQATKEELKRGYKITTAVIPEGCTKYIEAPEVVWNQPFKASLHESCERWMAGNVDKTFTAGGNMRAPTRRLLVAWVLKAWEELDTELVKKSFKVCGLTVAADGSEDHLIHCFKEGGSCAAGREKLAQARRGEQEDDGEAEQPEEQEDVQQLSVIKVEDSSEWSPSLDQKKPEPQHIKEEQEELWTSQEGEQLHGLMEADITRLPFTVKSEDDEEKPQTSQLHQSQTEDNREAEPPTSSSATQIKTETDGEDCGGSEPGPSHPQLNTDEKASDCSDTDVSFGNWQEPLLDSGPETGDSDCGYEETRTHESGVNNLKYKEGPVSDVGCIAGKKTCSCLDWGQVFHYKGSLRGQAKCHLGNRSLTCVVHKKCCRAKEKEDSQMRVEMEEKPFDCSDCGTRFSLKRNLDRHVKVHTGKKPFGCGDCGMVFSLKSNLGRHMQAHTRQKPYGCDVCGNRFTRQGSLKAHMRVHSGDKPFGCGVCSKRFKQARSLKSHAKVHSG